MRICAQTHTTCCWLAVDSLSTLLGRSDEDVDGRGNTHSADSSIETDIPLSGALEVNEGGTVPAGKGGGGGEEKRRRRPWKAGVNVLPGLPPARA